MGPHERSHKALFTLLTGSLRHAFDLSLHVTAPAPASAAAVIRPIKLSPLPTQHPALAMNKIDHVVRSLLAFAAAARAPRTQKDWEEVCLKALYSLTYWR